MDFKPTEKERRLFEKLNTPQKIQDYLDTIPVIYQTIKKDTMISPRQVMEKKFAHCLEGAMFAAAVLWYHGRKPLLLDLVADDDDLDHVVCLFKQEGLWGAIAKSNHAVLRWRDPIYKSVRELAVSYFHEYFMPDGRKSLKSYSEPFDLKRYGTDWITSKKNLWHIAEDLDRSPHNKIVPPKSKKFLRKASKLEIKAGELLEWKGNKKIH